MVIPEKAPRENRQGDKEHGSIGRGLRQRRLDGEDAFRHVAPRTQFAGRQQQVLHEVFRRLIAVAWILRHHACQNHRHVVGDVRRQFARIGLEQLRDERREAQASAYVS